MRRSAILPAALACLLLLPSGGSPARELRITHPDGTAIRVKAIDFRRDSIVLSVAIDNPAEREIRLNKARSFTLAEGAGGIHHLNPPADNPEMRIPPDAHLAGTFVFIGPIAPDTRQLTLSANEGVGTPDNPYDNLPALRAVLPVAEETVGEQAGHPDGAALRVLHAVASGSACLLSLLATNGNDRPIRLAQDHSLTLTDVAGRVVPADPPVGNAELAIPPDYRLEAELAFDCRGFDTAAPVTLSTNRDTTGTPDNPYETLPVFALRLQLQRTAAVQDAGSHVTLAAIERSRLSAAAVAQTEAEHPAAPASPEKTEAPAVPKTAPAQEKTPPPEAPKPDAPPAPAHPAATPPVARPTIGQIEAALHATRSETGQHIVLSADDLFGSSGDKLAAEAEPVLSQLAQLIEATHPREVMIAAHTDSSGNDSDNQTLSEARARAVADWLAAHLPKRRPPRLVAKGYGRTRPLAPNHNTDGSDNPDGRARNRRIEITLRR